MMMAVENYLPFVQAWVNQTAALFFISASASSSYLFAQECIFNSTSCSEAPVQGTLVAVNLTDSF
jgi:hypothetical protein